MDKYTEWLKINGDIPPHCKHLTELSGSIANVLAYLLIIVCFDVIMVSQFYSFSVCFFCKLMIIWVKYRKMVVDKSINEWCCRLACMVQQNGVSNIYLNN